MISKTLEVTNEVGLHARPAATLVKLAAKFSSSIEINYKDRSADCKSILSLMSLRVKQGEFVDIKISGSDEEEAMVQIENLFENDFQLT